MFINTLVGGLGKMEGGQKSFELLKGGDQKDFSSKWGGSKKFGQIESIMKLKMHNLLPKSTGYSLKLDLYFKIFLGPSAGPALHLSLKMPLLAQLQVHLALKRTRRCRIIQRMVVGYIPFRVWPGYDDLCIIPALQWSSSITIGSVEPVELKFCFHHLY